MRVGKSTALNNFHTLLTGKDERLFDEKESIETNTRGIHIILIPFDDIVQTYQIKILESYKEKIDIVLLDCEGTESSDNIGTSKLYLMNMLINSVIHIHVSKAIDENFVSKLSQALVSSNKVIEIIGGNSLNEILPALWILIKDTSQKAWENAKKSDPNIRNYEDLLKKYKDLLDYYYKFPESQIDIIPPPFTDSEGLYLVNDKKSLYWKELERILDNSLNIKRLKTQTELISFTKNMAKIINENKMMCVKSELETFYQNMFLNEKNKLIMNIVSELMKNFFEMMDFSPEEIFNKLISISVDEIDIFKKSVKNISCKWIFNDLQKTIDNELNGIKSQIEKLFEKKKAEYILNRELTKKFEMKYEERKKEKAIYKESKSHCEIKMMCKNCGEDPKSKGCYQKSQLIKSGGDLFIRIVTFGILGYDKIEKKEENFHAGPIGKFCERCRGDNQSSECNPKVIQEIVEFTETILTGIDTQYTKEEWKNSEFKNDAFQFFSEFLKNYKIL
jgi:hypothetical protein